MLNSIFPVLAVTDVSYTVEWYKKVLGFEASLFPEKEPFVFALMRKDNVEIAVKKISAELFKLKRKNHPDQLMDAYIRTANVQEWHDKIRRKAETVSGLKKQPYGDIEFTIRDCNGYIITFGGDVEKELNKSLL
jgi:uncharacterized glyoxalase superfamily protein PhnB